MLRSDWLTTGPKVAEFEQAFAEFVGTKEAVAVSSGTAALHAAMHALGIGPGDEVIVPAMTFAATANCVVYQGGIPIFADVESDTLLLDPTEVESKITPRTKAVIAVDYAGQPCDYNALRTIADRHDLWLIADACHSLGGRYKGRSVGSLADLSAFSFHPVKHITTGEGGMITTDDHDLARRLRAFRNHGITTDHRQREEQGSWFYEMIDLGYNYRLTDFQCALGLSQLRRLDSWIERRQEIARRYDRAFADIEAVCPLKMRPDVSHAYHLYVIRLDTDLLDANLSESAIKNEKISQRPGPQFGMRRAALGVDRSRVFSDLRAEGIGVNVHYIPVHLHPFYRQRFKTAPGMCPVAERAYEQIISLPMFPRMNQDDVEYVIAAVRKVIEADRK